MQKINQFMAYHYPIVRLHPGRERSLLKGHPWLFSRAVAECSPDLKAGDVATILSAEDVPLGLGFYHPRSDIAIRFLTQDVTVRVDIPFWQERIHHALMLRQKCIPNGTTAFRLINAEGDFMPGLVVDQYHDVLVIAIGTAGMENARSELLHAFIQEIQPKTIIERSEGKSRLREGLGERTELCFGTSAPDVMEILENGLRFQVNVLTGQKTGFFLDQRPNRELARTLCKNAVVLNCFSYSGAFSVYCAAGGAQKVISVDSSDVANRMAEQNLRINGFSPADHPVVPGDVFRFLRETSDNYDLIVLDPPAFAKSRNDLHRAARGYKDIHWTAMRRIVSGGLLMTFSCSNFVNETLFEKIVLGAARDAGKNVQLIKTLGAGPDHPVQLAHPEGKYLKGLLLRITDPQ